MALPCASAKRSRLLPEVYDDCSSVTRRLSPCERAIIREVNKTLLLLSTSGRRAVVGSESCERAGYSVLSADLASPVLRRLHSVFS